MELPTDDFGCQVTRKCYEMYKKVCKQNKKVLAEHEWTNMACMVQTDGNNTIEVVTLATGTKCIGESQRVNTGRLLNDSHAEVLARRLLVKYFYKQLDLALKQKSQSIFHHNQNKDEFSLRGDVKFHLFTTEIPCGDASIFPKTSSVIEFNRLTESKGIKRKFNNSLTEYKATKRAFLDDTNELNEGNSRFEIDKRVNDLLGNIINDDGEEESLIMNDVHRTGAKCVSGGVQDSMTPGSDYHALGALRVKPGRGFRTISMSCSDKLLKWSCLGLQGGLLRNFITRDIHLSSIIVSAPNFDRAAMDRAFSVRGRKSNSSSLLDVHKPVLMFNRGVLFEDSKESVMNKYKGKMKVLPSGTAILWCGSCNVHEFSSNGRRHGVTKKLSNTDKACTTICKKMLLQDFENILEECAILKKGRLKTLSTYYEFKHACAEYEEKRTNFFSLFSDWTRKDERDEHFEVELQVVDEKL